MEMFTIVGLLAFRALQLSIVLFSNDNVVPVNEMEIHHSGHAGMVFSDWWSRHSILFSDVEVKCLNEAEDTVNQADFRNCIEDIITSGLLKVGPTYPLHITLLSRSIIFHIDTATATIKMYINIMGKVLTTKGVHTSLFN